MVKKAIFLGVKKFHSNSKNKDFRTVEYYVPPYMVENNITKGGVITVFTALDSSIGSDIKVGSIVIPKYECDGCGGRAELVGFEKVKETPYVAADFA